MELLVFITDDGTAEGGAPIMFLAGAQERELPGHPRGLGWKYVATISDLDNLTVAEPDLRRRIDEVGYHIANHRF